MAMSGIKVDASVDEIFNKLKKGSDPLKYMVLKIENKKNVVIDYTREHQDQEPKDANYVDEIREMINGDPNQCRWIITEINYVFKDAASTEPQQRSKVVFIGWIPDTCKIGDKMIYASTQNTVTQKLKVDKVIPIKDLEELNLENIVAIVQK